MPRDPGMLGGTAAIGPHTVHRMGFGAMQLAGPGVFGPPKDRDEALRVLRRAVELERWTEWQLDL